MRFITLSALFLFASTTLAVPLDISSRHEDTYSNLALRDGVADTGAAIGVAARSDFDDENWLERRIMKTANNKAARKERKTAAKAEVAQARQKGMNKSNAKIGKKDAKAPAGVAAARKAGNTAAQNKKHELRTAAKAKHLLMKAAGAEHGKTSGLPGRDQKFTIAAGNGKPELTFTGKDVRKANFASHIKNSSGNRFGKQFNNDDHVNRGNSKTTKPIPGMVGVGHEHPLSGATNHSQMKKDQMKGPARIISQSDASGHQHMGVVAHDQSRPSTQRGANDHFLVNPT